MNCRNSRIFQILRPLALAILLQGFAVIAACGGGSDSVTLPPPQPPPPPPPAGAAATVQQVFTSLPAFTQPVVIVQAPNDASQWYVVEQAGIVRVFANNANVSTTSVFLDISARVDSSPNEGGLLGLAFHPDWPNTSRVFVSYTANVGGSLVSRISYFASSDGGNTLDSTTEVQVLQMIQPFGNHNGGDIKFGPGPDNYLYAAFGDGGSGGDPQGNGQNPMTLLGTILRLDVDGPVPYGIPMDNPNFGNAICVQGFGAANCPEIFAWGLRNPWRFSFDSSTGDLWLADVGQGDWEEVNRIESGLNYGWNTREGAHCFPPASSCSTANLEDPITEYGRSSGASITGGYVYRGTTIASLVGWYVFGDFISGRIFAVPADSQPTIVPTELDDTSLQISTFVEGIDGEIYLIHYSGGTIYQLVPRP